MGDYLVVDKKKVSQWTTTVIAAVGIACILYGVRQLRKGDPHDIAG